MTRDLGFLTTITSRPVFLRIVSDTRAEEKLSLGSLAKAAEAPFIGRITWERVRN